MAIRCYGRRRVAYLVVLRAGKLFWAVVQVRVMTARNKFAALAGSRGAQEAERGGISRTHQCSDYRTLHVLIVTRIG